MNDDPHFISPAERAEGEPGERGCPRAEAEEREAETSAPEKLARYRGWLSRLPELVAHANRPHYTFFVDPAKIAQMELPGKIWHAEEIKEKLRTPLRAHFNESLRAGKWLAFGYSELRGVRERIRSPWHERVIYLLTHSEVLFYLAGAGKSALPAVSTTTEIPINEDQPRDTSAHRVNAKKWLADYINKGKHARRDDTCEEMRAAHPGLSKRGSLGVFRDYSREHPDLNLSNKGRKLKRSTNN